jgi:hypothetical protein
MRKMIGFLIVAFVGGFIFTVGSHLANEGRALMIGVLIGVVASIPAALISILVTARTPDAQPYVVAPEPPRQPVQQPLPIVIVNPGQGARSSRYAQYAEGMLGAPPQARTFTVIGDDK